MRHSENDRRIMHVKSAASVLGGFVPLLFAPLASALAAINFVVPRRQQFRRKDRLTLTASLSLPLRQKSRASSSHRTLTVASTHKTVL